MNQDPRQLGIRLAQLAKERGLSQLELSRATGINTTTINRIFTGASPAQTAYLCRIADAVGVVVGFDVDFKQTK